CQQGNSRPPTF
nr:immunoglobulin light chain junction region [Macaca mulatta]MOV82538.1 immunoglobulin light chain junction region [Macaca mulatta]